MDERLHDLLEFWEEKREQGVLLSADDLRELKPNCFQDAPEMFDELKATIKKLETFRRYLLDPDGIAQGQPSVAETLPEFADYQVERQVGFGGMGRVYLAKDKQLGLTVAIKLLDVTSDLVLETDRRRLAKRFLQEAQTLARLNHPHIVRVFAGKPNDHRPYFAMEYLPRSLAEPAEQETLRKSGSQAIVQFMIKVAQAVQHAHGQGVLHRDLKPANILMDESREPKVCDFGLAKLVEDAEDILQPVSSLADTANLGVDLTSACLTRTGRQPGTPAYMAPEQHESTRGTIDQRTDIWALGVILFELLIGHKPFLGKNRTELRKQVLEEPPQQTPCQGAQVIGALRIIALRCLEKDPKRRFSSVPELMEALWCWQRKQDRIWRRAGCWLQGHAVTACFTSLAVAGVVLSVLLYAPPDGDSERSWDRLHTQMVGRQKVVLLAETGKPLWSRWSFNVDAHADQDRAGFFTIQAFKLGVLELVKEVPCTPYRIHGKIRHDVSNIGGEAGVYFAARSESTQHGRALFHYRLTFNDIVDRRTVALSAITPNPLPKMLPGNLAAIEACVFMDAGQEMPWAAAHSLATIDHFSPTGPRGGTWRSFSIEILPQALVVSFDGKTPKTISVANREPDLAATFQQSTPENLTAMPPLGNPSFTTFEPRGAFGVFVKGGVAAFSDIVLEPLVIKEGVGNGGQN